MQPFTDKPPVQLYTVSNYWMGPLQGVVVAKSRNGYLSVEVVVFLLEMAAFLPKVESLQQKVVGRLLKIGSLLKK